MLRTCLLIGAVALAGALPGSAFAQSQSLFGSSGPRGQSSSGQSSSATSARSGTGGGLQGSGGLGGAGGSATAGAGGFGGPQLNQAGDLSAQAVGNGTGFVGRSNTAGFVGNRMAGTGGGGAMQPSFGGLGGGGSFGGSDFNSQNNQDGSRQGSSKAQTFRPRYRLGFEHRPAAGDVSQRAAVQVNRLTATNPALAGVQIAIGEGGVAEIRGQAPTDAARRLVENLVRLEPGVRRVNNLIEVVPAAPNAVNP